LNTLQDPDMKRFISITRFGRVLGMNCQQLFTSKTILSGFVFPNRAQFIEFACFLGLKIRRK
jgi:hypothetical protein